MYVVDSLLLHFLWGLFSFVVVKYLTLICFFHLYCKMSWFIFFSYFIGYNCFCFWMRYEILKISPCFKRLTLAKYLHLNNYIPSFAMNDKRLKWILKTISPLLFSSLQKIQNLTKRWNLKNKTAKNEICSSYRLTIMTDLTYL